MLLFIIFIFGLIVGSFLNAVIYRLHSKESFWKGRSHCVHCKHELSAADLFPVLSYVFLGGRCRYCRAKISMQYPIVELATGIIFLVLTSLNNYEIDFVLLRNLYFASVFIVIAIYDFKHYLILDKVVFPNLAIAFILNIILDVQAGCSGLSLSCLTFGGIVAAVAISGFFFLQHTVSKGRWIGFGDVKLGLLLGMVLGWPLGIVGLFLGYVLGALTGVSLILAGQKKMSSRLAFGTFLCFSGIMTMMYGRTLLDWYLTLIGL